MGRFIAVMSAILLLGLIGLIGYALLFNHGRIPGTDLVLSRVQPTPTEQRLIAASDQALAELLAADPGLQRTLDAAFAVFVVPNAGRGGFIVGGGGGSGAAYRGGHPVGTLRLRSITVGLQIGGQRFTQIILVEDQATFDRLRDGDTEATVQATAVALEAGAAASVKYTNGIAILIAGASGLMAEASLGSQRLDYWELGTREPEPPESQPAAAPAEEAPAGDER